MDNTRSRTIQNSVPASLHARKNITPMIVALTCILFLIILSVIVTMSYRLYVASFYEYSSELCLNNNAEAAYVIDGDMVEHYAKTLTVDKSYREFADKLDVLKEKINAKYFYILFDNGVPGMYTYIYDATQREEFHGEQYALGRNETVLEFPGADQVLLTGKGFEKALRYSGVYGELVYAYAPIVNSAGEVVAFVGTDVDITPLHTLLDDYLQKVLFMLLISLILFVVLYLLIVRRVLSKPMEKMEQEANELSVSLSTVQGILNHIDTCIYVSDLETEELLFVNNRMLSDYGLDESAFGKTCWSTFHPNLKSRCERCPVHQLKENPHEQVMWIEHAEHEDRIYRHNDRIIDWIGGKKVHLRSSTDVTEMKQIEGALQERLEHQELMAAIAQSLISAEPMHILIENALQMLGRFMQVHKVVITSIDCEANTLTFEYGWANEAAGFTLKPETIPLIPGNPTYEAFINGRESHVTCADVAAHPECVLLTHYGVRAFIIAPIVISGKLWGAITVDDCVGSRQWQDSEVQLVKLVGSILSELIIRHEMEQQLLLAKEAAEEASKAKGEFLSRMSHEMRTPMTAIIGMTNIAKGAADIRKKDYCLDRIDSASKHLLGVINAILDISKIEANKFDLYCREFNLEKMLMNVTNVVQVQAEEKEQSLLVQLDTNVPISIIGDELRLSQVITNLLSNAVKFTGKQGAILVEIEAIRELDEDLTLQVSVADNGIGIAKGQQSKLFTFFEQVDGSISRNYGGTGLGLAICKRIVELMGGRIWIESEAGKGSKFIFTANVKRGSECNAPALAKGLNKETLRILAVDDSLETREYFTHLFEKLEVAFDVAASGSEALELLGSSGDRPYNVFFIDWKIHDINGVEVARRIRETTGESAIIIMMSVAGWDEIEKQAKEAGVNLFIPKPLFASSIIDCLNACMGVPAKTDQRPGKKGTDTTGLFQGHTILVAEDVEVNREIIYSILEPSGVIIDFAEHGSMALSMFSENPDKYSLILMDIQMPQLDGYEVTSQFRALNNPRAMTIPIIAMTANVFREDIERCLAAGMDDHVGKPLDVDELMDKLSQYLPVKKSPSQGLKRVSYDQPNSREEQAIAAKDYVNVEDALNRLLGNQVLYAKLLGSFDAKAMVGELVKAIDSKDLEKVVQISHALKGAASNLGLGKLSMIASKIEKQAAVGIDTSALTSVLREITDATNDAIQSILESGEIVCSREEINQKF